MQMSIAEKLTHWGLATAAQSQCCPGKFLSNYTCIKAVNVNTKRSVEGEVAIKKGFAGRNACEGSSDHSGRQSVRAPEQFINTLRRLT